MALRRMWARTILCLGLSMVCIGSAIAQTSPPGNAKGSVLYVGGNGEGNYSTIQEALDVSSSGDTIYVFDEGSPYPEHLHVATSIVLVGERNASTLITGNGTGTVVTVTAPGVVIDGFSIESSGSSPLEAAVRLNAAPGCVVQKTWCRNVSIGVYVSEGSSNASLLSNTFSDCQTALFTASSSDLVVAGNHVSQCDVGIYCTYGSRLALSRNLATCKWEGLHLERLSDTTVADNVITGGNNGLIGILCSNLSVVRNTVERSRWMGVRLANCSGTKLCNNSILDCDGIGVYLSVSSDSLVSHNLLVGNDDGMLLECSRQTLVTANTFQNLKNEALCISRTRDHQGDCWWRNFWGRPRVLPFYIKGTLKLGEQRRLYVSWDLRPCLSPPVPPPATVPVSRGDLLYVGGSGPGNYSTIQEAVADASPGDTVFVYPGEYFGGVVLDKALTLAGADPPTTVVDGQGYDDVVTVAAPGCTVRGLTLRDGHFGFYVNHSYDVLVTDTILINNFHGATVRDSRNVTIAACEVTGNQFGIRLFDASAVDVTGNILDNFKRDAHFIGSTIPSCLNSWHGNYWGRARLIAVIEGRAMPDGFPAFPFFNVDRRPLLDPPSK